MKFKFLTPKGEGWYWFWEVKFLTRGSLVLRVPYPQAPMVALEALRRDRETNYLAGVSPERLQDVWERIDPLSTESPLVVQWLAKLGEKFGFTGETANTKDEN